MSDKKVVIIGDKESFIVRVLTNKIENEGIECAFSTYNINYIRDEIRTNTLYVLYMEENKNPNEGVLNYLKDSLEKKGGMMILIGDVPEMHFVEQFISERYICERFSRPIDNVKFIDTVKGYFDKHAAIDSADENQKLSDSASAINKENMSGGESINEKKSILVVDDDINYLSLTREWLKSSYKVLMANSGLQAIKLLGKNKVDLILLDYEMPVTSGPQVLEMLRSDDETKNIPVMFLTGKDDKDSVIAVMSLRPDGYILKSVRCEELIARIEDFFILYK